jgi:anti-sigma B factor antagonist
MSMEGNRVSFDPAVEESLTCEVVARRDAVHLRPAGTLDLATAPVLEAQLAELRDAGFRELVIDLRGLTFMDSSGLRLVLRWNSAARADGFRLSLVPGAPRIQRVFDLTRTAGDVVFVDPDGAAGATI